MSLVVRTEVVLLSPGSGFLYPSSLLPLFLILCQRGPGRAQVETLLFVYKVVTLANFDAFSYENFKEICPSG